MLENEIGAENYMSIIQKVIRYRLTEYKEFIDIKTEIWDMKNHSISVQNAWLLLMNL